MADLDKRDNRKDWLRWAIELMRRGIWVGDEITVHGPHDSPRNFMWGEAEGILDGESHFREIRFRTSRGSRGIYDVRDVRVVDKDDGTKYALLRLSDLSPRARRWLAVAQRQWSKFDREDREAWMGRREAKAQLRSQLGKEA